MVTFCVVHRLSVKYKQSNFSGRFLSLVLQSVRQSLVTDSLLTVALSSACGSESDPHCGWRCVFVGYLKASPPPPYVWVISGFYLLSYRHFGLSPLTFAVGDQCMFSLCAPTWATSLAEIVLFLLNDRVNGDVSSGISSGCMLISCSYLKHKGVKHLRMKANTFLRL